MSYPILETSTEWQSGKCGAFNGETVCGKPRGHATALGVVEADRWHRFGSPYDARWVEYDVDGVERARGGGIWRYVHAVLQGGGLACGDERADLMIAPPRQVDGAPNEAISCPGCRAKLGLWVPFDEPRVDGGPQTREQILCTCGTVDGGHAGDCWWVTRDPGRVWGAWCGDTTPHAVGGCGDAGCPGWRAQTLTAGTSHELDYEPLGEDVGGHAMFWGFKGHDDGRRCAHHRRLDAWVFQGFPDSGGAWFRCLRDDHPDLATWRYGAPRLTHLEELPKGALIRDHTSELCLFLNADHKSACRLPEPGEQRLFQPVEPQCRCHPAGSQASMTLGYDHEDGCPLKITRTAAPVDLLGLGVELAAVEPTVAQLQLADLAAQSPPIDPETGQPYTLATLDTFHAYVGLGAEWLASDRRRELWAAVKLFDLGALIPRRPLDLWRMSEHVTVTREQLGLESEPQNPALDYVEGPHWKPVPDHWRPSRAELDAMPGLRRCGAVGDARLAVPTSFGPCILAPHEETRDGYLIAPWHLDERGQGWMRREPVPSVTDEVARLLLKSENVRVDVAQAMASSLGIPPGAPVGHITRALEAAAKTLQGYADARTVKP